MYECMLIECCVEEVAVVCVCGDESMCGALRKGLQWAMQTPGRQKGHIQMVYISSDGKPMILS